MEDFACSIRVCHRGRGHFRVDRRKFIQGTALGAAVTGLGARTAAAQPSPETSPSAGTGDDEDGTFDNMYVRGPHPWSDVIAHGADPTGDADSTEAFADAIAAGAGSRVFIPAGIYRVRLNALYLKRGVEIFGAGAGSIIKPLDDARGAVIAAEPGASDIYLHDFFIDGNRASSTVWVAIELNSVERARIERIQMVDISHTCVSYTGTCTDVSVRDCTFRDMGDSGINGQDAGASALERFWILRNHISSTNGSSDHGVGIQVYQGRDGVVSDNVVDGVSGQFLNGIVLRRCTHVSVTGNTSRRSRDDGLTLLRGCDGIAIQNNRFTESIQTAGIYVIDSTGDGFPTHRNVTIVGNILDKNGSGNSGQGILIQGGIQDLTIVGNSCSYNNVGIQHAGGGRGSNLAIVGNLVAFNRESGIILSAASDYQVTNNLVRNNGQNVSSGRDRSGIMLDGSSDCLIAGNRCLDDQTSPTQQEGIRLLDASRNLVESNFCNGNAHNGIILVNASQNQIHDNRCEGNSQEQHLAHNGIAVHGGSFSNSIQGNQVRRGSGEKQQRWGIITWSPNTLIMNNDLLTAGAVGSLHDGGTETTAVHNRGVDL